MPTALAWPSPWNPALPITAWRRTEKREEEEERDPRPLVSAVYGVGGVAGVTWGVDYTDQTNSLFYVHCQIRVIASLS